MTTQVALSFKCNKAILIGLLFLEFHLIAAVSGNASTEPLDTTAFMQKVIAAHNLQAQDPDAAFLLAQEVLSVAADHNYEKGKSYAYMRMGSIYNRRGVNDSALKYIEQTYKIREKLGDLKGAASAGIELSYIYNDIGQVDSAYRWILTALQLSEQIDDTSTIVNANLELANLMIAFRNESPLPYFERALTLAEEIENWHGVAAAYSGQGYYYYESKKYQLAEDNFLKALSIFKMADNQIEIAKTTANIALCKTELEDYQEAKKYFKQADSLYNQLDLPANKSTNLSNLANLFLRIKQPDSTLYYSDLALKIAHHLNDLKDIIKFQEIQQLAYHRKGNYEQAYQIMNLNRYYRDSLLNNERIRAIEEMQTKYETEKKEQEIELLNAENKTKETQRKLWIAVSIVLTLFALLIVIFYIQRGRIAKKNELIAAQEIESILDEQDIKTYNAMLEGQEEERMRIATDLHDRLGSMLSTVKLLFSALENKIDLDKKDTQKQYNQATNLVDEACVEVRRVSHNLGTGMVANFGLFRSLEELCERINDSGKINCEIQTFGIEEEEMKLNVEVALYRIAQEVINNALKYAEAKSINVQLTKQDDNAVLMIVDDGIGFDLSVATKKEGMGLKNIRQRASKLGGSVHIDSQPGRGVTTIINIPLDQTV